jgi:hypothetical protein
MFAEQVKWLKNDLLQRTSYSPDRFELAFFIMGGFVIAKLRISRIKNWRHCLNKKI